MTTTNGANPSLFSRGVAALRAGDITGAKALLQQAVTLNSRDKDSWLNLALAEQALKNPEGELAALEEVLKIEPRTMVALLLKGGAYERLGDIKKAGQAYSSALQVAPPFEQVPNELQPAIRRAVEISRKIAVEREAFIRDQMAAARAGHDPKTLRRFEEALDVVVGRKAIYRQRPLLMFWPGLAPLQFFPREDFPWLDEIEASTDDIKSELLEVLRQDKDMVPYINYSDSMPLDQWRELNRSPNWSAYHLIKDGVRVEEHCQLCPKTVAAVGKADFPVIPGQSPVAMYSILKPHTTIPPHTGATNIRLVCHLPLIVPDKCLYRVGNDERKWEVGKAWIFDDTIEHEARNDSDQVRVVLIFDVWNPHLNEAERELAPKLLNSMFEFNGGDEPTNAEAWN